MPFTVITLKRTPNSLRGDLTKWMQEIATGVYVGNFNIKIREKLWERVIDSVENGEATISYYSRNEIGYDFKTYNTENKVVDFDGIPLVMSNKIDEKSNKEIKYGFSNASKFRKANKYARKKEVNNKSLIFIDLETDGLDENSNNIIEIGALRVEDDIQEFQRIIKIENKLPENIKELTGISQNEIDNGVEIKEALRDFIDFIEDLDIIGYNVKFDMKFINKQISKLNMDKICNKSYDLMAFVKKDNQFLENYKFQTVLKEYGIDKTVPHRALEDARLCYELSSKVNKFEDFIKKK